MELVRRPDGQGLVLVVQPPQQLHLLIIRQVYDAGYEARVCLDIEQAESFLADHGDEIGCVMGTDAEWLAGLRQKQRKVIFIHKSSQPVPEGMPAINASAWDQYEFLLVLKTVFGHSKVPSEPYAVVIPNDFVPSPGQMCSYLFIVGQFDGRLVMFVGCSSDQYHHNVCCRYELPQDRILGGGSLGYVPKTKILEMYSASSQFGTVPNSIAQKFSASLTKALRPYFPLFEKVGVKMEPLPGKDQEKWARYL